VTEERNGNRPVRLLLVDMEAALNAGHWVESARDMQLWAIAVGRVDASTAHASVVAWEDVCSCLLRRLRVRHSRELASSSAIGLREPFISIMPPSDMTPGWLYEHLPPAIVLGGTELLVMLE
jgi:hypothetical protein